MRLAGATDCSAEVHQPVAADHDERLDTALDGLPGEVAGLVPFRPWNRRTRKPASRSLGSAIAAFFAPCPAGPGVHEHRDLPGHLPTLASPRGAVGFPRDVGNCH